MKIEPGKKYRVIANEPLINTINVGTEVTVLSAKTRAENLYCVRDDSGEEDCFYNYELGESNATFQVIAENLWQTLCYVKQALDSGAPIDKEYIAKVLAENRPEEIEPLT